MIPIEKYPIGLSNVEFHVQWSCRRVYVEMIKRLLSFKVSRSASKTWSGRAYFSLLGHPALLKVNEVRFEDSGLYTCSAVFRDGSIINSTVRLHVVGKLPSVSIVSYFPLLRL